jgi:hypothetical protein
MRFQFDGSQPYQLRAIEAVADLFRGQSRVTIDYDTFQLEEPFSPLANRIDLDHAQLLANLHAVQQRNGLPPDRTLELIEDTIRTAGGEQPARFESAKVSRHTQPTAADMRPPVRMHSKSPRKRRSVLRAFARQHEGPHLALAQNIMDQTSLVRRESRHGSVPFFDDLLQAHHVLFADLKVMDDIDCNGRHFRRRNNPTRA